jgi:hypothetical protein
MTQTDKTEPHTKDHTAEPLVCTIEIDPTEFDGSHEVMFEWLVDELGRETVTEMIGANLQQGVPAKSMRLLSVLWNSRKQSHSEPQTGRRDPGHIEPGGLHD